MFAEVRPATFGMRVDRLSNLRVAGRLDAPPTLGRGLVVENRIVPIELQEFQERSQFALLILNDPFVSNAVNGKTQQVLRLFEVAEAEIVQLCGSIQPEKVGHAVVQFEVGYMATEHAVTGMAQCQDDFGVRKQSVDVRKKVHLQGVFVDEHFLRIEIRKRGGGFEVRFAGRFDFRV